MPYGFYQLVRFLAMSGFVILAYKASERPDKAVLIIYICLAILFQPLIKISLGRSIWNIVDVIIGIGLIIMIFYEKENE
jgi:O-antigen ligase